MFASTAHAFTWLGSKKKSNTYDFWAQTQQDWQDQKAGGSVWFWFVPQQRFCKLLPFQRKLLPRFSPTLFNHVWMQPCFLLEIPVRDQGGVSVIHTAHLNLLFITWGGDNGGTGSRTNPLGLGVWEAQRGQEARQTCTAVNTHCDLIVIDIVSQFYTPEK